MRFNLDSSDRLQGDEQSAEESIPEPLSLETLFHRYGIERSHADNVARNALELFDILKDIHGLGPEIRRFVEIAALVHDTGVATDFENHHKAGRAILRLHPPSELPERLWPAVAWTAFLHKKKIGKKNEKSEYSTKMKYVHHVFFLVPELFVMLKSRRR